MTDARDRPGPTRDLGGRLRAAAARLRKTVRRLGGASTGAAPLDLDAADGVADTARAFEQKAAALLELGRFAEAEAVCSQGLDRFADRPALARMAAQAAAKSHDWAGVTRWSALLRERFASNKAGYQLGLQAAKARMEPDLVEAITADAVRRFPGEAWVAKASVQLALDQRRWGDAITGAEDLRRQFPAEVGGYDIGVQALAQARRIEQAEALHALAVGRLGERPELTRLAQKFARWQQFDAKDAQLRATADSMPNNLTAALRHAKHMDKTARDSFGQSDERLMRLQALLARHPRHPVVVAETAKALIATGRVEEAEALLASSGLIADDADVAAAWAASAEARGDEGLATDRYGEAIARFPEELDLRIGQAQLLTRRVQSGEAGSRERAEAALGEALARFPDSEPLHDLHAWIARHAGDHATALVRWRRALERFPASAKGRFSFRTRVLDMALMLGVDPDEDAQAPAVSADAGAAKTQEAAIARFQNLGSTLFGCEFGGVQRHFGIEPLHLLRWASCPIESLIDLLNKDFEGFMDEADARLDIQPRPGAGDEYMIRSIRYRLRLDTFVPVSDAPVEQVLTQIRRRNLFLTRKLREELARPDPADKTLFVYKAYEEHVGDESLQDLARALNRTGPNTLLAMRRATATNPAGHVEWAGEALLVGYLPDFGKTALGIGQTTLNRDWLAVMDRAGAMWDARHAVQSA